jgi:hypothetical protein
MDPERFNPIHTAAVKVRLRNFKSSFLCVLCLFAAIFGFFGCGFRPGTGGEPGVTIKLGDLG